MKATVEVAAIATNSRPGQTAANLENMRECCGRAAQQGAELVLFPELSVTGFIPNHPVGDHAAWLREVLEGAWRIAERLDGPAVQQLLRISADAGVFLAAGLLENAGNTLFNTHVLVGEGRLYGYWRKMHIPMFEMQVYNGCGVPEVVDTPLGRIGANVCFDALLPESTRLLSVQGCEIVLFPFAADPPPGDVQGWKNWARPVLEARCAENGVYGIACNYRGEVSYAGAGQRFPGGSLVVGPDGRLITDGDAEMLRATICAERMMAARAAFEYTFRFRRPELYASLAEDSGQRRRRP